MSGSKNDLTTGNIRSTMLRFALPYLLSSFLQTFYGLADLFVVGLYNGAETTTAVSIGSQVMHMLTVMLVGLAMGTTVEIGQSIGARDNARAARVTGASLRLFAVIAAVLTVVLSLLSGSIVKIMMTPAEAAAEAGSYLHICFAGLPFIIAYNLISSIYRGSGDSRSPLLFVAIACAVNIAADFLLIGGFGLGAAGAAWGTVFGQGISVAVSLTCLLRRGTGFRLSAEDLKPHPQERKAILKVGIPICTQDGLIQVAFILITVIANSRGLIDSAAVGVVEKLISFLFLVPSAFLSAISAITAQNMGAGKPERARSCLHFGLTVAVSWGVLCALYNQFLPQTLIGLFTRDQAVITAGCAYMMSYSFDCIMAAIHFCFSGYFCGIQRSEISFIHNILSVALVRVPGAWLASRFFPDTLYPMGLAAPLGSALSALICIGFYIHLRRREH